jgi:hypothetical protein
MLPRMLKPAVSVLLLLCLPACVAAIGNKGATWNSLPASAKPLLQEKIEAARRIVELRQQRLDSLRSAQQAGRVDEATVAEAEIAVEEARIRLLDCRAQLQALEGHKPE